MKLSLLANAGLLGLAAALLGRDPPGHEYLRLPWYSRSPCPGLNVMANHGWLPRSGRDIDLASLQHAVVGAFNYAPNAFDGAFQAAIDFNLSTTGNPSTFHLADLAKHDAIEFDGSLSRNDYALGDNLHFDPAIWHTVAQYLGLYRTGPSKADKYVTVETAARARAQRVRDAMRANPHFNASANEMFGSPGTTALYLTTLWDDKADAAPKAWIRAFFEEERIPYREGYKAPQTQRGNDTINAMFARVTAVPVSVKSRAVRLPLH
ncbi:fc3d20d0-5662-4994-95a4-545218fe02f0 [Thermothielavioides terrestris]|uniref:Fc3d20d0-5662-4994-95a4-545218fe02f0 n=1 Tax=Thermothielavioides terrestris TaxID=2587410 RepID=A0A3S4AQY6_9PEZI|nr:fc3d20d0-5662-4994-95a4-545218fe02f0 [Thermothielavioides terrestris]